VNDKPGPGRETAVEPGGLNLRGGSNVLSKWGERWGCSGKGGTMDKHNLLRWKWAGKQVHRSVGQKINRAVLPRGSGGEGGTIALEGNTVANKGGFRWDEIETPVGLPRQLRVRGGC